MNECTLCSQALRIEAQKKRAAEEEAERSRILAEESNRKSFNEIPVTKIDDIVDVEEEEIVVAEENVNVESEIAFDFMEADPAKHDSSEKEPLVYKEGLRFGLLSQSAESFIVRMREAVRRFIRC